MGIYEKHGKFYIDYYYRGKRVREAIGTNRKVAKNALGTRKTEILQGRYRWVHERKSVRFEEFADAYLEYAKSNKRAWTRDQTSLKHLKAFCKDKRLSDITPWLIEKYKRARKDAKKGENTIDRELTTLKNLFSMAVKWGKVLGNPVKEVKFFRVDDKMERILSPEEEEKLLNTAADHLRPILLTALNTGMRLGEILHLTWDRVNLPEHYIVVAHTKNGKVRKIPMNAKLTQSLKNVKDNGDIYVFPDPRTGKPYGSVKTAFNASVSRAKIGHLRFHDLRHTFATRLVLSGVDLATVAELLGHSSIKMTMRYAHPTPEAKKKAVDALESYKPQKNSDGHYLDTKPKKSKPAKHVTT